jgi:hypothetical protein
MGNANPNNSWTTHVKPQVNWQNVLAALTKMGLRRQANASSETLKLFTADVMDFVAKNESLTEADTMTACERLGCEEIQPFDSRFPAWPTVEKALREASRDRRIAEAGARRLGDGRRPGESEMEQWKREADTDGPDDEMKARMDRLNAKLTLEKKFTQTPQTSTPPQSISVGDMQPDECDAFVTFLETMSYDSLQAAMRAAGTIRCADDQAVVARALRALWLSKGKDARNLLVLVKGA